MNAVRSPCRSTCKLNQQDVCVGCYRHMDEIANWNRLSERQKHLVIIRIQKRRWAKPYADQDLTKLKPITSVEYRQYKNR
ncbi:DUF1289 domain-containing protein [Pleionea mediterranea]|uniref:DUF1289 domain-containing protein n=1 Tax=Pleionea mediterranea TaxID=523701 RepID=UPI000D6D7BF4|nr:DUF1289 domain-containing protein [Pleionea mediterranea]